MLADLANEYYPWGDTLKFFCIDSTTSVIVYIILLHVLFRYDVDKSNFIDLMELKLMMEKLGEPQTHLGLKAMIKEVDEDNDGEISFREVNLDVLYNFFSSSFTFPPPSLSLSHSLSLSLSPSLSLSLSLTLPMHWYIHALTVISTHI